MPTPRTAAAPRAVWFARSRTRSPCPRGCARSRSDRARSTARRRSGPATTDAGMWLKKSSGALEIPRLVTLFGRLDRGHDRIRTGERGQEHLDGGPTVFWTLIDAKPCSNDRWARCPLGERSPWRLPTRRGSTAADAERLVPVRARAHRVRRPSGGRARSRARRGDRRRPRRRRAGRAGSSRRASPPPGPCGRSPRARPGPGVRREVAADEQPRLRRSGHALERVALRRARRTPARSPRCRRTRGPRAASRRRAPSVS